MSYLIVVKIYVIGPVSSSSTSSDVVPHWRH